LRLGESSKGWEDALSSFGGLFGNGASSWTFAPAVSLPIFDAGSGAATVRAAEISRDVALAAYERSIQTAFREVADALAQRRDIAQLLAARQSLVTANEKTYRLTEARYRRGVDSSLAALDAQRSYYSAQQNLITARLLEANNLITLYSVLGGGWR
jgi:multidrug efflux system outer membrane protein